MKAPSSNTDFDTLRLAAEQQVRYIFERYHKPYLHYHNLKHTEQVVEKAITIAHHYDLTQTECAILEIASWFHDTGHLFGPTLGHEEVGVARFLTFIKDFPSTPLFLDRVIACILSTKMPQQPFSFLEAIICDADTYHLGTPYFEISDTLIKQEITERTGAVPADWELKVLDLLSNHCYHTFYCYAHLQAGKQRNFEQYLQKAQAITTPKHSGDPSSYSASAERVC